MSKKKTDRWEIKRIKKLTVVRNKGEVGRAYAKKSSKCDWRFEPSPIPPKKDKR